MFYSVINAQTHHLLRYCNNNTQKFWPDIDHFISSYVNTDLLSDFQNDLTEKNIINSFLPNITFMNVNF